MSKTKAPAISPPQPGDFGTIDSRLRDVTLNVALFIAILTTIYFGIHDAIRHRPLPAFVSLIGVIIFSLTLLLNYSVPRLRRIINIGFVIFIGMVFLVLLATRFPAPSIVFWCFPFPLLALFLLGGKRGAVVLIIYNFGVGFVFFIDLFLQINTYTYDYAFRYCGVMIVISVLSYYYEASRARSHAYIRAVNQSLEQRVQERTKALEESQERLRQAEKLEAVGLLAGGVAHDFNNQLAAIMGFADLIRLTAKDTSEIREPAESIIASSRRCADLTGQLLAFARKGAFLSVPLDIHRIIEDVISLLKHTIDKRIIISRKFDAAVSTILGDANQLHNALLNCALNARDAMPEGGDLVFATDTVDMDESYCATLTGKITPGTYLHLCITDTGCGMDKNTLKHIFEPFFTTKEPGKGTGLGLSAVYGTVQSHNGAITVSSAPGSGSSFHLYFPLLKTGERPINVAAQDKQREKAHGDIR